MCKFVEWPAGCMHSEWTIAAVKQQSLIGFLMVYYCPRNDFLWLQRAVAAGCCPPALHPGSWLA